MKALAVNDRAAGTTAMKVALRKYPELFPAFDIFQEIHQRTAHNRDKKAARVVAEKEHALLWLKTHRGDFQPGVVEKRMLKKVIDTRPEKDAGQDRER